MLQKQVAIVVTVVIAHLHVTETRLKVGDGEVVTLPDTVLGLEPLVLVAELSLPAELTVPWRVLGCLVGTAALTALRAHQLLTVGIALEPQVTQGATQSLTVLLSQSPPGHHSTSITDPPSHPPAGVHPWLGHLAGQKAGELSQTLLHHQPAFQLTGPDHSGLHS